MSTEFNPIELAKNSKTFCVMPWIQQYVGPAGDVKPCCVYQHPEELGNLKQNSLKEIWNSEASKDLRLKMLNNQIDSGCKFCDHQSNLRPSFNRKFFKRNKEIVESTLADGTVPNHKILFTDVRFNNLCNLSCRTCSPHFSTSWVQDYKKLHNITTGIGDSVGFQFAGNTEEHALEEILPHVSYLQEIGFAGGEPMMQKEHYILLQKLIDTGNLDCDIQYTTNLTRLTLGQHDVVEYWKKLKNVQVNASLDGSHDKAKYWRHGTDWNDVVNNRIRLLQELPDLYFRVGYTLSWVNAHNLVEFHKEWIELGYMEPNDLRINVLVGPEQYALVNIPNWKKEQIEKVFRDHMRWLNQLKVPTGHIILMFEQTIATMWNTPKDLNASLKHFKTITSKLDEIRNESFYKTFPEHRDLLSQIGE